MNPHSRWTVLAAAMVAAVTIHGCNCGGDPIPCEEDGQCPTGSTCEDQVCSEPDGGNPDGSTGNNPDAGDGGGGDSGVPDSGEPCTGLECQQVTCPGGGTTTLTGTVYTPKGDLPLYNAIVYVPNGTVQPFPDGGVTCDRCGAVSGSPIASALTGPDGKFTLTNVPAGTNIPLVIQLGKWRRQVTIPSVTACTTAELTAASELTRMPRNQSEGDIPKMALATGQADPFECLLLKVGIDPEEITPPTQNGRVHYFRAGGGVNHEDGAPDAGTLWSSQNTLKQYDVVMLPCEGTNESHFSKTSTLRTNIADYAAAGGRLFTTHWSYRWINNSPFPTSLADWHDDVDPINPYQNRFDAGVDTSFPKGEAFADWLVNVSASETRGWIGLYEVRHMVDSVDDNRAQQWISGFNARVSGGGGPIVPHFTFNTPVDPPALPDGGAGEQCGRVVYSSFHVSQGALDPGLGSTFPAICKDEPPTAQEKALIFMFFDLASCVQDDDEEPELPTCGNAGASCTENSQCCSPFSCLTSAGGACAPGQTCTCDVSLGSRGDPQAQ